MQKQQPAMVILTKDRTLIGTCVHFPGPDGWKFIPATTSRRTSRKFWSSATECIPKWAFDLSEEMLTAGEFGAWQGRMARAA